MARQRISKLRAMPAAALTNLESDADDAPPELPSGTATERSDREIDRMATGAPLEILHVVHDPAASPVSYKADQTDPLEPIAEVARRKLDGLLMRLGRDNPGRPGLGDAVVHCVSGLPASKILDVARTRGARLLVLGGGRKNGLERFLHGSTAHQVARKAQLPVTIIKADNQ